MEKYELLQWAVKGIRAEIDDLEKQINKGNKYLTMIENGEKSPTKLSADEIKKVISEKKDEIERLDRKRFNIQWEISELEEK